MHERDFALVATGVLSQEDLWSNFLALTRKQRLARMRAARRRIRIEVETSEPTTTPSVAPVAKLLSMIVGMYIVQNGSDKDDRLIVRCNNGKFDGYYVYQRGSFSQQPDQFSIQVLTHALNLYTPTHSTCTRRWDPKEDALCCPGLLR